MSDSVKKIKIASYDDLFNPISSDSFDEGTPAKVPVDQLTPFPHHPFKLYQDERMQEMVQSIRSNGVLTPILVRPSKESSGYEIISGHNRVAAAKLAGLSEVPAIIRQMDDETAIVAMVDSNLRQREKLLPSEKAFAFKMKLDAMRRKAGRPPSNNSGQLDLNYSKKQSRDLMAEKIGESGKQINRYIRLTELIPLALDCVDQVQFNGDACYMLRCSYLHSGVADIQSEDGKVRVNRFELAILNGNDEFPTFGESSGIISDGNGKILDRHIRVDIRGLCLNLCDEAERQYNETSDKQLFFDHSVKILNLPEEIAKINELNMPQGHV